MPVTAPGVWGHLHTTSRLLFSVLTFTSMKILSRPLYAPGQPRILGQAGRARGVWPRRYRIPMWILDWGYSGSSHKTRACSRLEFTQQPWHVPASGYTSAVLIAEIFSSCVGRSLSVNTVSRKAFGANTSPHTATRRSSSSYLNSNSRSNTDCIHVLGPLSHIPP
jgi:hypothetical protein